MCSSDLQAHTHRHTHTQAHTQAGLPLGRVPASSEPTWNGGVEPRGSSTPSDALRRRWLGCSRRFRPLGVEPSNTLCIPRMQWDLNESQTDNVALPVSSSHAVTGLTLRIGPCDIFTDHMAAWPHFADNLPDSTGIWRQPAPLKKIKNKSKNKLSIYSLTPLSCVHMQD